MVFSSISFLCFFLPLLLIAYYIIPKKWRNLRNFILLAASLFFYAWGGPKYLILLLLSIIVNYVCGYIAAPESGNSLAVRKTAVASSVIVGIGLLFIFKYVGFFAKTLYSFGFNIPIPQIVLPIGISFFTFQGLSYVIDVFRGDAAVQKNPLNIALYIVLFPQLVAGPIVRYTTVAEDISGRSENLHTFSDGIVRFCIGLSKKMLLANIMGQIADIAFARTPETLTVVMAWIGAISYTFQIYFDFSAYSDMAIGLGKMFGFNFNENFNYPYIATSITDFWRRWHISLSTWFRDYVYIPLGGNRCSKIKNIRNFSVVWLLTGLWHGANWTFILWGIWFLILLAGEKYLWGKLFSKLPLILRYTITMLAVILSWVLFRSDTVTHAFVFIRAMFGGGNGVMSYETLYYLKLYSPAFLLCAVSALPIKNRVKQFLTRHNAENALIFLPKLYALALLLLSYIMLTTGSFNPFIYFQF